MIELKENSIFHEKIDKTYLYNNFIDVYVGLDIFEVFDKLNNITLFVNTLQAHCRNECLYRDEIQNVKERMKKLESLSVHLKIITHSRYKRGLINAIGSISKSLFGTLDNDDLDTINANIDKLFDANNNFKTIVNNQTALIRKIIESNSLQQIDHLTANATLLTDRIKKDELMSEYIIRLEGAMSDIHFSYDELLTAITLAKQGIISSQIIDRAKFMSAYENILETGTLNTAIKPKKENFQLILDIADLKLFITNNKLFFKISIPLLPGLKWDIDRIYPIPTKKNNVFMIPVIEHQIYLISGMNYINVDNEYIHDNCKTKSGITMCKQTQPIHDRHVKHDCISELINFDENINACKIVILKIDEITFIPLKTSNQFIAIPEKPILINTICGTQHELITLKKPSLIKTQKSCDLIYGMNHMRIGETRFNVSYEIKRKEISTPNDTNFDIILTKLEASPKILSNINEYRNTLDQIQQEASQLQFEQRIKSVKSWGISILQMMGYTALAAITIWGLDKLGILNCIKSCLPTKLCIHLFSYKSKTTHIENRIEKQSPTISPAAPVVNLYAQAPSPSRFSDTSEDTILYNAREEPKLLFKPQKVRFHKSIIQRK